MTRAWGTAGTTSGGGGGGTPGPPGSPGASIEVEGEWDVATTYPARSLVRHTPTNRSYLARQASTGQEPAGATDAFWQVVGTS